MAQAAYSVAAPIRDTTESETQWRGVAATPQSRWKRLLRIFTEGEIAVPIGNKGDDRLEYAQRWAVKDIASLLSSAMAILVVITFSIITIWMNTNKESSNTLTETRERVIALEGEKKLLQSQIDTLKEEKIEAKASKEKVDNQLYHIRVKLGMDIEDGTVVPADAKGK